MEGLTKKELEVLELICKGLSNKEIAKKLGTTEGVIRNYRYECVRITGSANTANLTYRTGKQELQSWIIEIIDSILKNPMDEVSCKEKEIIMRTAFVMIKEELE